LLRRRLSDAGRIGSGHTLLKTLLELSVLFIRWAMASGFAWDVGVRAAFLGRR
jgi:hypothetical protein